MRNRGAENAKREHPSAERNKDNELVGKQSSWTARPVLVMWCSLRSKDRTLNHVARRTDIHTLHLDEHDGHGAHFVHVAERAVLDVVVHGRLDVLLREAARLDREAELRAPVRGLRGHLAVTRPRAMHTPLDDRLQQSKNHHNELFQICLGTKKYEMM